MADTQLRRMLVLQNITRFPKKITTRELLERVEAQGIKTNIRAIQRDLDSICATGLFGVSADTSSKPAGWYWMRDSTGLQVSIMDLSAAIAFEQMRISTQHLLPKTTRNYIDPYFQQAEKLLNNRNNWYKKIAYSKRRTANLPDISEQDRESLYSAIDADLCISANIGNLFEGKLVYQFAEVIQPLGLMVNENRTFLVFLLFNRKRVFSVPLHRIKDVTVLNQKVVRPETFDLERYVKSDPLKCIYRKNIKLDLIISCAIANYLYENPLGCNQQIEPITANQFRLIVMLDDTDSLRATIRSFGTEIQVISPANLKPLFEC